jgi:lipoate-protein ligase A
LRWRLLLSPPYDGPLNMALDHALMARARRTGESVLRVYEWASPVLSLGRNQRARGVYDDGELARRSVEVVRRPTGGRALLHHREVTYSVTAPAPATESLSAAYGRINALLLDALASLGVPASLALPTEPSRVPWATPCFAEPAKGEIVVNGRKLAGSAQWRDDGALLQHGSIIVEDDQVTIPLLMRESVEPAPPPATLREILGRAPRAAEIADALFRSVRRMEDASAISLTPAEIESLDISSHLSLYRDPAWTWRR